MQFVSVAFLIFLPVAALCSAFAPVRLRPVVLLVLNLLFCASLGWENLPFLGLVILITYLSGRLLENGTHATRPVTASCTVLCVGLLVLHRLPFLTGAGGQSHVLSAILAPVGLSFYTLQALSYVYDVAAGRQETERHLIRYAAFVSFFPTLVSGPITRAGVFLPQLQSRPAVWNWDQIRCSILQLLYGYFLKLVVAERLTIIVDTVYRKPSHYGGLVVFIASLCYSMELYCDFAGYSIIAIAAARLVGVELPDNFNAPYLAESVSQFWHRWHISLSTWLKDYVYIPLGGNRRGKWRKYLNILLTFAVSGLWHGSGLTFLIWGLLHGVYQVLGALLQPLRDRLVEILGLRRESFSHRLYRVLTTFLLVDLAWVWFRAPDVSKALQILRQMTHFSPWELWDGSLYQLGLAPVEVWLLLPVLGLILVADHLQASKGDLSRVVLRQSAVFRLCVEVGAVLIIVICGIWGDGYVAGRFIYAGF